MFIGLSLAVNNAISGGSAPFSPLSLFSGGKQGGWYDPSDLSTLWQDDARTTPVTTDGQTVGCIDDKSGNGNHLTQATAGLRPQYKTSGGLHWLEFDGTNDFLSNSNVNFTGTNKVTAYLGCETDSVTGFHGVYSFNYSATGGFWTFLNSSGLIQGIQGSSPYCSVTYAIPIVASTKYVHVNRFDLSATTVREAVKFRSNTFPESTNTTTGSVSGGNFANATLMLGRTNTTYFDGKIGSFIVVGDIDESSIRNKEEYVNVKTSAYITPARTCVAIGDSTIAAYSGQNAVMDYITSAYSKVTLALPNNTISQQDSKWIADDDIRADPKWVAIQVGLNDLNPAEAASVAIARLQGLVNNVNSCLSDTIILISKLTPCKARLISLYGGVDGLVAYQKWLDINEAIAGGGATPITGVDGRVTSHETALNDGSGNLAGAYDIGDGIHENNAGRAIIAAAWETAIIAAGGTV